MSTFVCYFCETALSQEDEICINRRCARRQILKGVYRIVRVLGEGGSGIVFEVIDLRFDVTRAIKRIRATSMSAQQQAEYEAKILARHARKLRFMPEIYDIWSEETDTYLVMEYVEGDTLKQSLAQRDAWPALHVEQFLRTLLEYLTQLDDAGIVHRDLKPDNIKRTPEGRYMLLDFGIAKQNEWTGTHVRGAYSRFFAPPEQQQRQKTDIRSDIYSLGATAYYLLTGGYYLDDSMDRLRLDVPLHPPSHYGITVSPVLEKVIMWMLELDPEDRPENPQTALSALDEPAGLRQRIVPRNITTLAELARVAGTVLLAKLNWEVSLLAFSPDGSMLAVCSDALELWHVATRECYVAIDSKYADITLFAWSPDGQLVAAAAQTSHVRLWDIHGKLVADFKNIKSVFTKMEWSPDSQTLSLLSSDNFIYLWRRTTPDRCRALRNHRASTEGLDTDLNWSPDGLFLASLSSDHIIKIWKCDGTVQCRITAAPGLVFMNWLNGSSSEILLLDSMEISVWNINGKCLQRIEKKTPESRAIIRSQLDIVNDPESLQIAQDSVKQKVLLNPDKTLFCTILTPSIISTSHWNRSTQTLALGSRDGTVRLWRKSNQILIKGWNATGSVLALITSERHQLNYDDGGTNTKVYQSGMLVNRDGQLISTFGSDEQLSETEWSPDGQRLAAWDDSGYIELCNIDGTVNYIKDIGPIYAVLWSPNGQFLIVEHEDSTTSFWQPDGTHRGTINSQKTRGSHLYNSNGRILARVLKTNKVELVGIDGQQIGILEGEIDEETAFYQRGVAWSPSGAILAVGLHDGVVSLWDSTGHLRTEIRAHTSTIYDVIWSSDSRILVTVSIHSDICVWNIVASPRLILEAKEKSVFWSPRWHLILVILDNGSAQILTLDGVVRGTLPPEIFRDANIIWAPNERMFAVILNNGTGQVWNADGTQHGSLAIGAEIISRLIWSPNGRFLTVELENGQYQLCDLNGQLLRDLPGWPHWSPDSRTIAITHGSTVQLLGIQN